MCTANKIRTLLADGDAVDKAYQSKFAKTRENLREQKEYIEALTECIDVSGSNFNADSINTLMAPAHKELIVLWFTMAVGSIFVMMDIEKKKAKTAKR